MEKLFYELRALLKKNNLPEFPSFYIKDNATQEIMQLYKKLYPLYVSRLSQLKDKEDFDEFSPLLFDFIDVPIYCENIDEIENLLKNEETIEDLTFMEKCSDKIDFVTANNTKIQKKTTKEDEKEVTDAKSGIEDKILDRIRLEILDKSPDVCWNDIAGLDLVKRNISEIVVWPMLRPDIFKGLRNPPKGLLLFGPPGTGKTMIGKCIASQCKATFFSISASSLTSKWVGEGEKMVKALFYLAREMQPSVIFIDEIDSLLSQRTDNENDGMRRIKTEFLVQFDGAGTDAADRILVIGATNRPHEIDEAARRRLVKRIYVPLPDSNARSIIIKSLISEFSSKISDDDLIKIADLTIGYSGSDMFNLCREAAMEPIREISDIENIDPNETRPIELADFIKATTQIRKSVDEEELKNYIDWNKKYGSV